jgi:hypothetical protein
MGPGRKNHDRSQLLPFNPSGDRLASRIRHSRSAPLPFESIRVDESPGCVEACHGGAKADFAAGLQAGSQGCSLNSKTLLR